MKKIVCISVIAMIVFSGCVKKELEVRKIEKIPNPICKKHEKIISHAFNYVLTEFNEAYLKHKDYTGAKAQLFLIENNSQTLFAMNINAAQASYEKEYKLAQKDKCDLSKFKISPILYIKQRVKLLKDK